MKRRQTKTHSYTKHRAVLSDTLAYETPLTFSNRYFYRFLKDNKVNLVASVDKNGSQFLQFDGSEDKMLEVVIKTLFHIGSIDPTQEIRFTNEVGFQIAVDTLMAHMAWTSFSLTVGHFPVLKILDKHAFLNLLSSIESLKSESKKIADSLKRRYVQGNPTISVNKVALQLFQQHCKVVVEIEKHSLKCSVNHAMYKNFSSFSIIRENCLKLNEKQLRKTPFSYKISHKENDHRELSIPHPKIQIELVAFYEEYKELIIHYCSLSQFSIRKPDSIANYIFFNDKLHIKNKGDNYDDIEESGKEYESLKTFFTYRKYPNIHRFYEDYRYHRAEKKYNSMFKFDISKCFDSLYTHSIAWAVYGKNVVKDRLKSTENTFPGRFDSFMQNANFGETNGILIGPEFSRIFAEIILQSVDKEVESSLRGEKSLIFKRDYEVYRYVDDYFVFFNDAITRDEILARYKIVLKNYKMSVSDVKSKEYAKPLITELTIAKDKIVALFDAELCFSIKKKEASEFADLDFRCNAKNLITKFKIIISESEVSYKDIMNFTLAVLNKRIDKAIEKFDRYYGHLIRYEYKNRHDPDIFTVDDVTRKFKHENRFTNFLLEMVDFTFFIYAVDPRVNFTIKLCRILSILIAFYTEKIKFFTGNFRNVHLRTGPIYTDATPKFLLENRDRMFKKISDEIRLILEKNRVKKYAQIESLYLLIAVQQLGKDFSLSPILLIKYFGFKRSETGVLNFDFIPNYFAITVLLFYIRDAKAYLEITNLIKSCILEKIKNVDGSKGMDTECTMLLFDILVCPYLEAKFKREMLLTFGIDNRIEQDHLINFKKRQKYWFTKWDKFNFLDEIEAKIAHEPY
jgi:hypothetical protein